jgi:carbonic anhydrase
MEMSQHVCGAVVVHCIDFRLQAHLNVWLAKHCGEGNYDRIAVAGAVKNVDFVLEQIGISHRLHQVKQVILINHEDCGAYGADNDIERHWGDLLAAEKKIQARFPGLALECFFLHLDGRFEPIPRIAA